MMNPGIFTVLGAGIGFLVGLLAGFSGVACFVVGILFTLLAVVQR
jgi:hypothetical protein